MMRNEFIKSGFALVMTCIVSIAGCSDDDDSGTSSGGTSSGDGTSSGGTSSGGTSSGGTSSGGTSGDPGDSPLATKLAACPAVQSSSDPAATACLEGSYSGKTLAGEDCSLTVKAGGAYDFTTPAVTYSYTPQDKTIRVFSHQDTGMHLVSWRISDPVDLGTTYELKFDARFGQYTQASERKIEIEGTKRVDSATNSASCVVTL